jgi:hypothetical protein
MKLYRDWKNDVHIFLKEELNVGFSNAYLYSLIRNKKHKHYVAVINFLNSKIAERNNLEINTL